MGEGRGERGEGRWASENTMRNRARRISPTGVLRGSPARRPSPGNKPTRPPPPCAQPPHNESGRWDVARRVDGYYCPCGALPTHFLSKPIWRGGVAQQAIHGGPVATVSIYTDAQILNAGMVCHKDCDRFCTLSTARCPLVRWL